MHACNLDADPNRVLSVDSLQDRLNQLQKAQIASIQEISELKAKLKVPMIGSRKVSIILFLFMAPYDPGAHLQGWFSLERSGAKGGYQICQEEH